MSNKKSTWKYNKLLTGRNRYYAFGDFLFNENTEGENKGIVTDRSLNNLSDEGKGILSAASSIVGDVGGRFIGHGMSSGIGDAFTGLSKIAGVIPGPYGAIANAGLGLLSGVSNRLFGSKFNDENIAKVEANINSMNNFSSNAASYDTLAKRWSNAPTGMHFDNNFIGKDGLFSNKAKRKAANLRDEMNNAQNWVQNSLVNNASNIASNQMNTLLASYAAFGGELNTQGANFTNGLLHINTGGTHELNPNEGVLMGMDNLGIPNLVEEGETIFNDYVFSDRLKVPLSFRRKYKLGGNKPLTFAEVSKKLAKESEERPNDPISIKGLQSIMTDLMITQENEKNNNEVERNNNFALGGGMKRYYGNGNPLVKGEKGWTAADRSNEKVQHYLLFIEKNWDLEAVQNWLKSKNLEYTDYNKFKSDVNTGTVGKLTTKFLDAVLSGGEDPIPVTKSYKIRKLGDDGLPTTPEDMPSNAIYWEGLRDGYSWNDVYGKKYKKIAEEDITWGSEGPTQTIFYEPITNSTTSTSLKESYYYQDPTTGKYQKMDSDNPVYDIFLKGSYKEPKEKIVNGEKQYYYDLLEDLGTLKKRRTDLRYTPAVGLGISSLTDAFGWTNKPDYYNSKLIDYTGKIDGSYNPVKYTPIGNYLTYNPIDVNYYTNNLNASAGASRRSILNTAAGNRGTAIAGLLAADNNYMNQIGELGIKAEEENYKRRRDIADFNRTTDITNSEGMFKTDSANQSAETNARDFRYNAISKAAELRLLEKNKVDEAKSANLSGFLTSLGNIGKENMGWNWRDFGVRTGSYGNISREDLDFLNVSYKKGGKLKKKRKGLTY